MSRRRTMSSGKKKIEVVEELKSTASWTPPSGCTKVDVFLVGGGGAGANGVSGAGPDGAGGGGGYTAIYYNVPVTPGIPISYTIGLGGTNGANGGYTQFLSSSYRAEGGKCGGSRNSAHNKGGDGGSGGGGANDAAYDQTTVYGRGGSDGADGVNGAGSASNAGGKGQGSTTRCPFNNKIYAGGGAGCLCIYKAEGGGGEGFHAPGLGGGNGSGFPGDANTGGGGAGSYGGSHAGGNGGSGIIILHYFKYA